jgi:glutamate carboxypeptidase
VTPAPGLEPQRLRDLVERRRGAYLEQLEACVNVDCGTFNPEGVNAIADLMQERFEPAGWKVQRRRHTPGTGTVEEQLGDLLIARLEGGRPRSEGGHRVLLVGHMDTVFPDGTAAERPFRVEGSTAHGPGVSDMKGGLLAGLHAVGALRDAGFDGFDSITYVCNPDEEIGSPWSAAAITDAAGSADVCFVLEGARENGDIVSARKGVADVQVWIRGRAAHSGVEPERGRSAILQAAHATIALHELTGRWAGVTVNVGTIAGGTRPNVVPERCELRIDVRATHQDSFDQALEEVRTVASKGYVPDVEVEVEIRRGFPPMEKTETTARLVERARAIASELGFEVNDAATGGASDANTVAGLGVPVLDGLGPVGGADHAPGEWLDLDSVVPRTTLLAAMIASAGT